MTYSLSRDDWIRTSDSHVPNVMRYRAALHPEIYNLLFLFACPVPPAAGSIKSDAILHIDFLRTAYIPNSRKPQI